MSKAQDILAEIQNGVSPEELARKVNWKELNNEEANTLLDTALNLPDNQHSYNLLVFLFRVSFGKDLWFSTEVLGQAVQHPNMTLLDRQAILPTLRSRLDQIKDQISIKSPSEENLIKYWLMEATYYSVNGGMLAVNGQRKEAAQNYQIAQGIFEQLGQFQQASKYKTLYKRLMSKASNAPLPKTAPIRFELPPTRPFSRQLVEGIQIENIVKSINDEELASEEYDEEVIAQSTMETARLDPQKADSLNFEEDGEDESPTEIGEDVASPEEAAPADQIPGNESVSEAQLEPGAASEPESPLPDEAPAQAPPALAGTPREEAQAIHSPEELVGDQPTGLEVETGEQASSPSPQPAAAPLEEQNVFESILQEKTDTASGVYYPLPDVWLEDGKLHILGFNKLESDDARRQMEQIRQQAEILTGIQLQIQIYLRRRAFLEHDMKLMERRAREIAARLEALQLEEKKITKKD